MSTPTLTPLLLLLLHLLLAIAAAAFTPDTHIYLDCGSTATTTVGTRSFGPDDNFLSTSNSLSLTTTTTNNTLYSTLYATARLFTSTATYKLPVKSSGVHVLRLHFSPFSTSTHDLSLAKTSVHAAQRFLLLADFSTNVLTIREFFLWAEATNTFELQFDSDTFSFVSAIELFTVPPDLMNASLVYSNFDTNNLALETVYRLNVGGREVSPADDTMWRTWSADDRFVYQPSFSLTDNTTLSSVKYTKFSDEVAPTAVYSTARVMNITDDMRATPRLVYFNVTWILTVVSGYEYLVRLHFCDFLSMAFENTLFIDVYVGESALKTDFQSRQVTNSLSEAFYLEEVADAKAGQLKVSISPSLRESPVYANAYLNGLEVFKLNNSVGSLNETFNPFLATGGGKNNTIRLITVLMPCVAGGLLLVGLTVIIILILRRRSKRKSSVAAVKPKPKQKPTTLLSSKAKTTSNYTVSNSTKYTEGTAVGASPRLNLGLQIPLSTIIVTTSDFDEGLVIGSGGFGKVYKAVFPDGQEVAVKRGSIGSNQGYPEFHTEISLLSEIRHRHLVSIIGYCDEESERILVYEYMAKGPLKDYLYGPANKPVLSWKQRLEICIGAAKGIHYLHTGFPHSIIHRDLKSSNILLDEDYLAKVSDFGLSKVGPMYGETHVTTRVKGTFGYMDPEYFKTLKLTDKSDVYSFGVMLFEVLCARPVIKQDGAREEQNLAEWAIHWHKRGQLEKIIDPKLEGKINENSLRKFAEIAVNCLADYGVDRPTFGDILWNLEYALKLQETEVRREPYEDSGVVSELQNVPGGVMMRLPSISGSFDDSVVTTNTGANVAHAVFSESQVFSQLTIGDGRL